MSLKWIGNIFSTEVDFYKSQGYIIGELISPDGKISVATMKE